MIFETLRVVHDSSTCSVCNGPSAMGLCSGSLVLIVTATVSVLVLQLRDPVPVMFSAETMVSHS